MVGGNYQLCGIIKGISGTIVEKNLEQTQLQHLLSQNSLEGSNIGGVVVVVVGDLWSVVMKVRTKVCTVAIKKKPSVSALLILILCGGTVILRVCEG